MSSSMGRRFRAFLGLCRGAAGFWCNILIVIVFAALLWLGLTLLGWPPARTGF